jgi:hypothetical protein
MSSDNARRAMHDLPKTYRVRASVLCQTRAHAIGALPVGIYTCYPCTSPINLRRATALATQGLADIFVGERMPGVQWTILYSCSQ